MFNDKNMLNLSPKHFKNGKVNHADFKGKSGMVIVVADWCHFCQMVKEPWTQFRKLAGKHFTVAAINENTGISKKLNVSGYPTIFSVDSSGIHTEYTGSRDLELLVDAMCSVAKQHPVCKK